MNLTATLITGTFAAALYLGGGDPWKAPAEADALTNPMRAEPKAATRGMKLFNAHCWQCHGMEGKGDGPAAPNLKTHPVDLGGPPAQAQTDGALFWKMTYGRGEMNPFRHNLSNEERWYLVSYIRTLKHD
jgi:mono/diheme cytochrome c family protein